jgi:hypothetical protein
MITVALARTRAAVRSGGRHAAFSRAVDGTGPVKDLSAFPVCGSVRPLAAQRRTG